MKKCNAHHINYGQTTITTRDKQKSVVYTTKTMIRDKQRKKHSIYYNNYGESKIEKYKRVDHTSQQLWSDNNHHQKQIKKCILQEQ